MVDCVVVGTQSVGAGVWVPDGQHRAYPEPMIGILGGYQTDYARNWTRRAVTLRR